MQDQNSTCAKKTGDFVVACLPSSELPIKLPWRSMLRYLKNVWWLRGWLVSKGWCNSWHFCKMFFLNHVFLLSGMWIWLCGVHKTGETDVLWTKQIQRVSLNFRYPPYHLVFSFLSRDPTSFSQFEVKRVRYISAIPQYTGRSGVGSMKIKVPF